MRHGVLLAVSALSLSLLANEADAQSGTISRAVGGYSFEEAAKEHPDTKNFRSADGQLTFAVVTQTAGNGFFDPLYVGAVVAGLADIVMIQEQAGSLEEARATAAQLAVARPTFTVMSWLRTQFRVDKEQMAADLHSLRSAGVREE